MIKMCVSVGYNTSDGDTTIEKMLLPALAMMDTGKLLINIVLIII